MRSSTCTLAFASLALSLAAGAWAQVPGEKTSRGLVIRIGIVPAEQVAQHPPAHPEKRMHEPRPRSGRDHLVISLDDARSGARVADATVRATVVRVGFGEERRALERMDAGGTVTFGGYFDFHTRGSYRIRIDIRRPGDASPTIAEFDYAN